MAKHVDVITSKLEDYIQKQLILVSKDNPTIALAKPFLSRIVNNNMYKVDNMLKQIADKDGLIDIDGILSETIDNLISIKPFKMDSGFLGELEIGDGKIRMSLPIVNKVLVFNKEDLMNLKDFLSK